MPVNGDTLDEVNETFGRQPLGNPSSATIADPQGTGTITDDDATPTLAITDAIVTEGNLPATVDATFTVSLSAPAGQTVTVQAASLNNTATAPGDYTTLTPTTLSFLAGETTKQVSVTVNGDALNELNETFFVNLASPTNATIVDMQGVGTITDDDPLPALSVNDVTVSEGNAGTANATFTVTLAAASGRTVTVDYATENGTATAPADYIAGTGTVTFTPGQTSRTVSVAVRGDLLDEINETYVVNLSNPDSCNARRRGGRRDDHRRRPGTPSLSINDVTVTEGQSGIVNANFAVALSAPSGQTVSVGYATGDGSATAGSDYVGTGGNLVFNPGDTTKTVVVQVTSDLRDELDETFNVTLTNPLNASIADPAGLGTIIDDDAPPTVSVNDVAVAEGNEGTVAANFHCQPERTQQPRSLGRLRDRERRGDCAGRLRRCERDAELRGR